MSVEGLVNALRDWKTLQGKTWPFAREAADRLEELAANAVSGTNLTPMEQEVDAAKWRAALAEKNKELAALREWRPISSAPKEFREILAIDDETGTMHVTWFEHGQWHDPDRHYYSEAPSFVPTRWLPIPPHGDENANR